jgi:hypothetical protein
MNRFLQIFTRWKWHLRPPHGPFYLALGRPCNIPGQVSPKRRFFPSLPVRDNPNAFIRFIGLADLCVPSAMITVGRLKRGKDLHGSGSSFFQGRGTMLSADVNKEQKVAMELKR